MKKQGLLSGLVVLTVIFCAAEVCQALSPPVTQYHYQDLAGNAVASALADGPTSSFQVTGYLVNSQMRTAFVCSKKTALQATEITPSWSLAFGINKKGQIVGTHMPHNSVDSCHAFLWTQKEGMQDLGTFGYDWCYANGINNQGQIVGEAGTSGYQSSQAFFWTQKEGLQILPGTLGGNHTGAYAINKRGQVVGYGMTREGIAHALLWNKQTAMQDLGTLGSHAEAYAINDQGHVVGYYLDLEDWCPHAFFWTQDNGMEDLGNLGGDCADSVATGINNHGQVVGYSYSGTWRTGHAFLWNRTEGMKDLNDPTLVVDLPEGVTLIFAAGINNSGQIAGIATIDGVDHAFLLTPVHQ